jgi:acyl-CoA synthetase (AMP-forming)/AMP-acid ligase II
LSLAPSFLKALFQASTPAQFNSVRLFVTGAEKAPQEIFDKVASLGSGKCFIEGYGITECAPILTLNLPNMPPKGVGKPILGVTFCTIDPDTHLPLKRGKTGELCVHGDNVFSGYLGEKRDPFIILDNKKWYRTGDLGYEDPDGNIILSGRIKRFAKIGGEMISLGALEEIIYSSLKENVVVCAREKEGEKGTLILFATKPLDKQHINTLLKESGMSTLVKISEIKLLGNIPLTGTGKIDYRLLNSMV